MNRRQFISTLIAAPVAAISWKRNEDKIAMVRRLMQQALDHYSKEIDKQLFSLGPNHGNGNHF